MASQRNTAALPIGALFQTKPLSALTAGAEGRQTLRRTPGPWSLIALGIGCIIGLAIYFGYGRFHSRFARQAAK